MSESINRRDFEYRFSTVEDYLEQSERVAQYAQEISASHPQRAHQMLMDQFRQDLRLLDLLIEENA